MRVCDTVKILDILFDGHLSFSEHVIYVSLRALVGLEVCTGNKLLLPETAKLRVVQSLVLSVFCYCYPAYGNGPECEALSQSSEQCASFCIPLSQIRPCVHILGSCKYVGDGSSFAEPRHAFRCTTP